MSAKDETQAVEMTNQCDMQNLGQYQKKKMVDWISEEK